VTRGNRRLLPQTSPVRRIALVAAPLLTVAAVGTGVASSDLTHTGDTTAHRSAGASLGALVAGSSSRAAALGGRDLAVSRDFDRMAVAGATNVAPPKPVGHRWTTAPLDLRTAPKEGAAVLDVVPELTRVAVTGHDLRGFAQVLVDGKARWVTAEYLAAKKPQPEPTPETMPVGDQSCPGTSGVESGLTDDAVRVYRAVCNNFPQITSYGGYDAHGEHSSGKAIDIMTSDSALGDEIAAFLQAHASELNLYDIIWQQQIWTPERASEGWRPMEDRGSTTANLYDHVHVSVN
jgi:hypothetical protein